MEHINDDQYDLLAKMLNGEASPEERVEAEAWLAADVARQQEFDVLKKIWENTATPSPAFDTDAAWENVSRKIGTTLPAVALPAQGQAGRKIIPIYRRKTFVYGMAAALALLISLPFLMPLFSGNKTQDVLTFQTTDKPLQDTLPDGSLIALNKGTVLTTTETFTTGGDRRVVLKGEAFFNVAHNRKRPFIIETTNHVSIKVLGTSFNVLADNDSITQITVATGRVEVTQGNEKLILEPGESGTYNRRTGKLMKDVEAAINSDAWKTNRLVFKDTELYKVVEVLNRFYKTNISFETESLRNIRYDGEFENESLEQVLSVIEKTLNIRAIRNNTQIKLKKDSIK